MVELNSEYHSLANTVFMQMQEGIIVLNEQLKIVTLNLWAQKVIGFKEQLLTGKDYSILFCNLSDYQRMIAHLFEHHSWTDEVAKKRSNGEVYIESMNISTVFDSIGKIKEYVVVFRDMTKQKLFENERQLAAKVLENISEGVIVTDKDGNILSVNPAFELVTGYVEEEVCGHNPRIFQSGIHGSQFYHEMWNSVLTKGKWQGEIWNKKKNGDVYPEWLTISSIKDEKGEITNFVAVFSDITDRKHTEEKLRQLAHYDSLTGVANRYTLNTHLESLIDTASKYNQQLAVLFLDLDRFKHINDTLGHNYGDQLLKEVSFRLKGLIKNKDLIARLGGDEFVIVLSNIKHPKEAVSVAENIIHALSTSSFILKHHEVYVSTSIGISLFPLDGGSLETLLRNADKAMYKAKSSGKNHYQLYHEEMHKDESKQMKMEVGLRKALEQKEFFLVYQPQIHLKTGKIIGIEALIRWKREEQEIISPEQFIPLAEETGLIVPISEWVIKQACEDIQQVHLRGHSNLLVSINISALHFNQENFVKSVQAILQQTNVNPHLVDFELTESMIMPNASQTISKLVKLKKLGIKLSIDDFGTGYSSLSYLNRFPLDRLKIDKSFIENLSKYHDDSSIVEAIISIAHRLNLSVVAEGVESKKQLLHLKTGNCDHIQGFYITKPLPLAELIRFLAEWEEDLY
ncbi:EAL domain-containing protein [Robertmurraya sp. FSL W8-0741]|uniref:sensor domain-containing protein n=2 Tax=Bacillaceae TaxID=186817 RepID=UPI001F2DB1E6|nr:GGDEF and EAL domain-containing protein [Robertmurraya siralis]